MTRFANSLRFVLLFCPVLLGGATIQKDALSQKAGQLQSWYKKAKASATPANRRGFLQVFPATFAEFYTLYYWNEKTDQPAPLYQQSSQHLNLFQQLGVKAPRTYVARLIGLSIGGKWEADAIGQLQEQVQDGLLKYPTLFRQQFQHLSPTKATSFWYFIFDNATSEETVKIKKLKELYGTTPAVSTALEKLKAKKEQG